MARMIPSVDPSTIENPGERELYAKLRDCLPASWTVRYNYVFCWYEGRFLRDAEVDFVVIAPGGGVLVLEAKSSHGYDCRDGQWYRIKPDGAEEETDNPFAQASRAKHKLVERIAQRVFLADARDFPGIFGHVVVYPFAKVQGSLPRSTEPTLMIAYQDMPRLKERLEDAFVQWGPRHVASQFNQGNMDKVVEFFSDKSGLVTVLAAGADRDERGIERLTQMQYRAFRGLLESQRVHVRGPAGSGKTILASWAAEAFAAEGKRVLFLCYNRVLAAWLSREHPGPGQLEIRSFFSVCQQVVRLAGLPFNPPSAEEEGKEFWLNTAPSLFGEALDQLGETAFPRYDAVLVDEGQDFHKDWWLPVQLLLRDPDHGRLCVFSDPEQTGVYGLGQALPEPLVPYRLGENCRNTRRIAAYCGKILDVAVTHFPDCPVGATPLVLEPASSPKVRADIVRREIVRLMDEKFTAARIAILSPWRRGSGDTCLGHVSMVNNKSLEGGEKSIEDWRQGRVIWTSTIKAFKGLEADCVILADGPAPGSAGFSVAELYVAASRAKHFLIIAPTTQDAADQYNAWAKSLNVHALPPGP